MPPISSIQYVMARAHCGWAWGLAACQAALVSSQWARTFCPACAQVVRQSHSMAAAAVSASGSVVGPGS
eukprot:5667021-Prorocentrum_lima.AAC.1